MSCVRYHWPKLRERILDNLEPAWLQNHPRRPYIVQAVLASLPWVDRRQMNELRNMARVLSTATVEYTLDHIVPLSHPYVCGLNVPWNLRIVPRAVNLSKGNNWHPDQLELLPA